MRILHGMREIAGQAYYSALGLRENKLDAKAVLWDKSKFNYEVDECLDIDFSQKLFYPYYLLKIFWLYLKKRKQCDVFHFHFGYSMLPRNCDIPVLRRSGKKVFLEFHGTDVRIRDIAISHNPVLSEVDSSIFRSKEQILAMQERLIPYSDGVIIHDDELLPYICNCENVNVVPLRIDLNRFSSCYPENQNNHVVIVHAPSRREGKGSKFILKALKKIQDKYPFVEIVLVEDRSQEEALRLYSRADIIIDQLIAGTYGVFAVESMALGKPVISYVTERMKARLPEELPIVSATIDDIYYAVEGLVENPNKRVSLGQQGRKYVEHYHDCRKVAKLLEKIYAGEVRNLTGREAFRYIREH